VCFISVDRLDFSSFYTVLLFLATYHPTTTHPPPPIIITSNTFNYIRGGNELIHLLHFSKIFFFDRYVVCRLLTTLNHCTFCTPLHPNTRSTQIKLHPYNTHTHARIEALVQVVVVYADFVRAFGTVMPMVRYRNAYCNAVGSTSANRPPSPLCDSP
jgi:hypothetical protein